MNKRILRALAMLMAVAMTLSALPVTARAEESVRTYTKVTAPPENGDWSGTYLMVYEAGGLAFDGSLAKLDAAGNTKAVTIQDGTISTAEDIAFTVAQMADGWSIQAASGQYIGQSKDANGLSATAAAAANQISFEGDEVSVKSGGGAYLRFNKTSGQERFRYYKSSSYTNQQPIALYRLDQGGTPQPPQAAAPTAVPPAGAVEKGTEVAFSCATEGAAILYKTDGDYQTYTAPISVDADTAFTVKAAKAGMADSPEVTFAYTILGPEPAATPIRTALEASQGTFTVKGVVTLVDGQNYYLQDDTGGICLRLSAAAGDIALGDTVMGIDGTLGAYNGLPQLTGGTYRKSSGLTLTAKQVEKIADLTAADVCTYVSLSGLKVTDAGSGQTPTLTVEDAQGGSIEIYRAVLPGACQVGDTLDIRAAVGIFRDKLQLRNTAADEITVHSAPLDLPGDGEKFIIYNQAGKAALAAENDVQSIEKADTQIQDAPGGGKEAVPGNGAAVFTLEQKGGFVRFYNESYGYLCSNGEGSNAFYSKDFSQEGVTEADADWLVRPCSGNVGGFELESRTAKFKGKYSQFLEYYSDSFKTYSMNNVKDYTIFSFFFCPLAAGTNVEGGRVVRPAVTFPETVLPAYVGSDYTLDLEIDSLFGVDGAIQCALTDANGQPIPDAAAAAALPAGYTAGRAAVTAQIPAADIARAAAAGESVTLTVSFQDPKGYSGQGSQAIPVKDEPTVSDPAPAPNTQTGETVRPAVSARIGNAGADPRIVMTLNGVPVNAAYDGDTVSYLPEEDLPAGRNTVTVEVTRADGKSARRTWAFTVGKSQYQAYFGQLHAHTQYSDGAGTLESALDYIKNLPESANVDFAAFTDHSNYFDGAKTGGTANPEGALYDMTLASGESQALWKKYKDTVAEFNRENAGSRLALAGFEMTWSGGPGHINTFNTPGIVSRNHAELNSKTENAGLQAYYKLLSRQEGAESISQFNHPGTTFGNFIDFAYWDAVIDTRMYMVEVGNGEGQIGAGGYYPSYEQYIMALDKGWHVAPTNNQDNHKGRWGNANDARDVILAESLTEEGIYAAIRERRMYATEDKNLQIGYTVNGLPMGSQIADVPEQLEVCAAFHDPDRTDSIARVEVVVNSGRVAHTWDDPADLSRGEVSVTLPAEYSYYFLRITQGDGDLAVTAPVWVGETLKLGISQAVCTTATPVTDEALTLTATFFNSEGEEAVIRRVDYSVGGVSIGSVSDPVPLPAHSTQDVSFRYTPTKARVMTVKIAAQVEQGGKTFTFTKEVTLDVLDADKLVYIGIDAAHYNEYVAGNYKDAMGNFSLLAAGYSVRTVQLNTSEELRAACGDPKFRAMILTAPSRRLDAAKQDPRVYTPEELAALTDFNARGGAVVLCGWSDNYENYPEIQKLPTGQHMAGTQNALLEALGSSLRLSDDATYDDVRSKADGVDKWRLYFSAYDLDHPLLSGVEFDPQHPYDKLYTERFSHYGGASVYAVDGSGQPLTALPETVQAIVYGHESTYSVDVDKDGLGGETTPKYPYTDGTQRLLIMAGEQLEGRGLILVSGAAFMSNFEVQSQTDSAAEKNYVNYRICENFVAQFNSTEVTPIAQIQAEPDEGVKFTLEGTVTSNASGFDPDTAFFDCIYVQDATAGINAFPVAGDFKVGDRVRITGTTSSYQGERQIAVTEIKKLSDGSAPAARSVTAAQVNDGSVLGSLVRLRGTLVRVETAEGKIQTLLVRDAAGDTARLFIDGYIAVSREVEQAAVGCQVDAVGLASYDDTFVLQDGTPLAPRIRIRDRRDIVCTPAGSDRDKEADDPAPETPRLPAFGDVRATDWFYGHVRYLYEAGLMKNVRGIGDKSFLPAAPLSRSALIAILYNAAGNPAAGSVSFGDVGDAAWFGPALAWAVENGIVNGYEDGSFRPDAPVLRQHLAVILHRYAAYRGAAAETAGDRLQDFTDPEAVSAYARPAMRWAVEQGLFRGDGGRLSPQAQASRAQAAAVLHRYLAP